MRIAAMATLVTPEEYLAHEELTDEKSEYEEGVIIPMPGATLHHILIMQNVSSWLDVAIADLDFVVLNSETRIRTPDLTRYTYPDVSVVAGTPIIDPQWQTANLTNPCLIVEVLSKSTQERDRGSKFDGYKTIPTLQEYVLIDQYCVHVTQWVRDPADDWHSTEYTSLADVIELVSVPVQLPLQRVYRRVEVAE